MADNTSFKYLTILVSAILLATVMGTLFSFLYPRVEIDIGLALLFSLVALVIVMLCRQLSAKKT